MVKAHPQEEMFEKPRQHTELPGVGYASTPGSGPPGETCASCANCRRFKVGGTQFNKCGLVRRLLPEPTQRRPRSKIIRGSSRATDIRLDAPACLRWKKKEE